MLEQLPDTVLNLIIEQFDDYSQYSIWLLLSKRFNKLIKFIPP